MKKTTSKTSTNLPSFLVKNVDVRATVDNECDMWYVYLTDKIDNGEVDTTVTVYDPKGRMIGLDFNSDAVLLGIELFSSEQVSQHLSTCPIDLGETAKAAATETDFAAAFSGKFSPSHTSYDGNDEPDSDDVVAWDIHPAGDVLPNGSTLLEYKNAVRDRYMEYLAALDDYKHAAVDALRFELESDDDAGD